ncbi:phosphatase PAP2 family protein [Silvanigrella aquatica]|uniref:Phosphatidic acid phosphatase type 2/haloperoxidase domain-containing protein n=1 Tax=Silvanigrella aquatica TaxID=1915309 RepID=A0A1L4D0V6_9BACT|nr:phosphatase PAP2 family protein [Silvanigrella aquatica]APJ03831.1 hypothetical protein AXG55_07895 [Silvanigrella aquatica]
MTSVLKWFNNLSLYITKQNTNILYFVCLAIVFIINIIINIKEPFHIWVEIIGSIIQIAIPMYVLVPILWKKDAEGTKQMLKHLLCILGITWSFKMGLSDVFGINDIRPRGGGMSFPSGHTSGAFSGAVFLAIRYGWKYALIALPLACFVGFSRIFAMAHWPSDVAAAIALCIFTGLCFVRPYKKKI